jgi:hypothetical protein
MRASKTGFLKIFPIWTNRFSFSRRNGNPQLNTLENELYICIKEMFLKMTGRERVGVFTFSFQSYFSFWLSSKHVIIIPTHSLLFSFFLAFKTCGLHLDYWHLAPTFFSSSIGARLLVFLFLFLDSPLGVSCVGFRHANMSPPQFLNSQLEEELEDMTMSVYIGIPAPFCLWPASCIIF